MKARLGPAGVLHVVPKFNAHTDASKHLETQINTNKGKGRIVEDTN